MDKKARILSFIKDRSVADLGTNKRILYTEFKDIEPYEINRLVKELKEEKRIFLCPLTNEETGLFTGSGYCTNDLY